MNDDTRFKARFNEITWYRTNVPCMEACPVHTDSGRYVQLIAEGRLEEAFLVARSPNPLASVCGRVCSAPCEDACRRGWVDEAVTIRPLKRFVTERFGAESAQPESFRKLVESRKEGAATPDPACVRTWHLSQLQREGAAKASGRKVAVIGSGPAGLACAHDLAVLGYAVTVFEGLPDTGGMLRYGIPEYRLPRGVIDREVSVIERLGAKFETGVRIDEKRGLRELRAEGFEACFVSVGASRGRDLQIPGVDKDGVVKAVDYLLNLNRGYRVNLGSRVIVIGGGSVALDAARTAVREFYAPMEEIERTAEAVHGQAAMDAARGALRGGASEVHVVSLESLAELPAARTVQGRDELREAEEEGIRLHPAWGPQEILGNGHVTGVRFVGVTRVFDESGRFSPRFDESKGMTLEADSVILAIGQQPDFSFLRDEDGVELTRGGTIKIDPETLATTAAGVYAGGDAAFGPRIAIEAVANGKTAARSIHTLPGRERARGPSPGRDPKGPVRRVRDAGGVREARAPRSAHDRGRSPHRDRRGRARDERGAGEGPGRALPLLPRRHHLRPRALRAVQPVRRRVPREVPGLRSPRAGRHARGPEAGGAGELRARPRRTPDRPAEGRHAVHSLRPVRAALPDGRDDDGDASTSPKPRSDESGGENQD